MSGFGEHQHHQTYDEVAAELRAAVRKLAAPVALKARMSSANAQAQTRANDATAKQLAERQVRQRVEAARLVGRER